MTGAYVVCDVVIEMSCGERWQVL